MAFNKLRTKISGKFDAEILLYKLETMTKEAKENPVSHWTFTTQGLSFAFSSFSAVGECGAAQGRLNLRTPVPQHLQRHQPFST